MKNRWYKEAVFYQIYPRSFKDGNCDGIGDIKGIISKIDYLAELGIDAIWFSPLYASPNADYGYDISDYKAINPEYGTMADFDEMVTKLHEKGIRVIMDLVINHTSDKHEWFVQARSSCDTPYRDYYYFRDGKGKNGKKPPNNWTSFFVGSAWQYDETTKQWYLHLFDKNQPDLNYFNPKVMEEIKSILRFWLDKGVDGFRCDVITLLAKTAGLPNGKPSIALTGSEHYLDGERMLELLGELRTVLDEYDAYTVGESVFITVPKALKYTTEGNEYLTTVFSFDHTACDNRFGIKQLPKKFSLKQLKSALTTWQNGLYQKSWNTLFWENHDCARIVGRYVSATKHHTDGAKMMATILLTLSGTPFIYQGQELGTTSIGMKDITQYKDVDALRSYNLLKKVFGKRKAIKTIAYCSRDNARTPMQWTASKNAGFTDGEETWLPVTPNYTQINVETEQADGNSVLHYYKKLIQLRKSDKAFVYGTYTDIAPKHRKVLAYLRQSEYGTLLVINNFSLKNAKVTLPKNWQGKQWQKIISNAEGSDALPNKTVTLKPYESTVYKLV